MSDGPDPALLSMTWEDTLFAHWPVPPERVAATLPDDLSVDTHEGDAYLGVVAFVMASIGPRGLPVGLSFGELNLRTYVRDRDGRDGVYFYNLDADDRVGVFLARQLFKLPYYRARIDVDRNGEVRFRSRRVGEGAPASFDATYGPAGEPFEADPGSRPHFLTERYRFYTATDDGRLYYGDIDHGPWPLAEAHADIRRNDLFAVNGFDRPDGDPVLHYAAHVDVTAGPIRRV
ncbi:MAG: YqjF family protein [Haloferacaceae archaeon]